MTPNEKAAEMTHKFYPHVRWKMGQEDYKERAKQCALLAVEEILNALRYKVSSNFKELDYYVEVKREIEKL